MRLKARDLQQLLPLLRPTVEIEIVFHEADGPATAPAEPPAKPRGRRWTPEARAAHGEKIRARKRKSAGPIEEDGPVEPVELKPVPQTAADIAQANIIKEALERERARREVQL